MNHGLLNYVGGKHRLAKLLVEECAAGGAGVFVDVFGGSAAVTLAATTSFGKLIYNDADGDLVNFFRVVSDPLERVQLFRRLRALPPSRRIYDEDHRQYVNDGFSFHRTASRVERARQTFYRHAFAFGGKIRVGGFAVSCGDNYGIKEVRRYRNLLRKLARAHSLFRNVLLENLDFSEIIRIYGRRSDAVLFIDPPYHGTEGYYSRSIRNGDHTLLAHQLAEVKARVVCTYYDTPLIRQLYPARIWQWRGVQATKNSSLTKGNKVITTEHVIIKPAIP